MDDQPTTQYYHVQVTLDFEYLADSKHHARILAANHISIALRLGTPIARRVKLQPIGDTPSNPERRD